MVKCFTMKHHDIRQDVSARMLTPPVGEWDPVDRLAVAIIRQAYKDVKGSNQEAKTDALQYFAGGDFANHCALLDVRPERLQLPIEEVKNDYAILRI